MKNMLQKPLWRYSLTFCIGILSLLALQKAAVTCMAHFDLLNPDVACRSKEYERSEWDYESLRQELSTMIDQYGASATVPHISVFFRDLKNGPRFGIREYENFIPASLLKVPIMIALLHQVSREPSLLDQRLTFEDKGYINEFAVEQDGEELELHKTYTVRELLEKMIKHSDNNSTFLLLEKINAYGLKANSNTFSDLGTMKLMEGKLDNTRLISLVNVYVTLYNATYLPKNLSQFALELLSDTTFTEGIVAGVPKGTRVAHKYGVHIVSGDDGELHDCGIVYHPSTPYVLCILTSGGSIKDESIAIRTISQRVYQEIDALSRDSSNRQIVR